MLIFFSIEGTLEHSLPPHEVPVENSSSEKSSDNSVAEVVPEKDAETPAAQDTTSVVEDKSETPEMTASSEKPEEEGMLLQRKAMRLKRKQLMRTAKGEGAPECEKFAKYYRSLCPSEWIERWNEQRENGTFPGRFSAETLELLPTHLFTAVMTQLHH
uniref:Uncharacterized protein n=1 Tax=Oryza meridionalis TaxID=40149 RepID=A0A0E0EEI2_9ORYZ